MLNGRELADFIKERQAHQVRSLRQAQGIEPRLAIVRTNLNPVVDSYMKLKQQYGEDVLIEVDVHTIKQTDALTTIDKLNQDDSVHGIIVQIPLSDPTKTDEVLNAVAAHKDVDGLAAESQFDPATPMAVDWLLAGYNVNLKDKKITLVGHGRLVGRPLEKLWQTAGLDITVATKDSNDLPALTKNADVVVCATGVPGLITADMVKPGAIIVDAGVATDSNGLVGDVAPDVRELTNIKITPEKGGVGPLTVCALFENVIRAASRAR